MYAVPITSGGRTLPTAGRDPSTSEIQTVLLALARNQVLSKTQTRVSVWYLDCNYSHAGLFPVSVPLKWRLRMSKHANIRRELLSDGIITWVYHLYSHPHVSHGSTPRDKVTNSKANRIDT